MCYQYMKANQFTPAFANTLKRVLFANFSVDPHIHVLTSIIKSVSILQVANSFLPMFSNYLGYLELSNISIFGKIKYFSTTLNSDSSRSRVKVWQLDTHNIKKVAYSITQNCLRIHVSCIQWTALVAWMGTYHAMGSKITYQKYVILNTYKWQRTFIWFLFK